MFGAIDQQVLPLQLLSCKYASISSQSRRTSRGTYASMQRRSGGTAACRGRSCTAQWAAICRVLHGARRRGQSVSTVQLLVDEFRGTDRTKNKFHIRTLSGKMGSISRGTNMQRGKSCPCSIVWPSRMFARQLLKHSRRSCVVLLITF